MAGLGSTEACRPHAIAGMSVSATDAFTLPVIGLGVSLFQVNALVGRRSGNTLSVGTHGDEGIDSRGAPHRHSTGDDRDNQEKCRAQRERGWVEPRHTVKQTLNEPRSARG